MQGSIMYSDSGQGLNAEFPAPPKVHWVALFLAGIAVGILVAIFVPRPYQALANSLVDNAWPVYFCIWLRELNPDSNSFFWCDAYVVVELGYASMALVRNPSQLTHAVAGLLGLASTVLGIATIFIIRKELLRHYNEREPNGLHLDGVITFFFSFLYFQSQLYPIAKAKNEAAMRRETASAKPIV
jgi:hypothetical protein